MQLRSKLGNWVGVGLFVAGAAVAAGAAPPDPQALAPQVDQLFAEFTAPASPGCALGVVRAGELVYAKGYGLASVEHGVPITPTTVFDIGSTSKQFTAAAILLLAADGKLSLDDPVRKFVPELPDYGAPLTLRHLLHHTSGLRDYIGLLELGGVNVEDVSTAAEARAAIARQKALDFVPGSEHSYSNSGYFLLSQVVEAASGKSFAAFAQERLLTPLGMTSSRFLDQHQMIVPRRASSYSKSPEGELALLTSAWEQVGDGGLQTTIEDLAQWDANFYEPKVGGATLVAELTTPGRLTDGSALTYARGLVVDDYRGVRRVAHGGAWIGYRAELMRFPDQRLSIITLCNLAESNPSQLALAVADLYLGDVLAALPAAAAAPAAREVAAPNAAELGRVAALYWSPRSNLIRRVLVRDGKLYYSRGPGNESELQPLGGDRFAMVGAPSPVELWFTVAAAGARTLELRPSGGAPMAFQEVEPATLSATRLAELAGRYDSAELDTSYQLEVVGEALRVSFRRGEPLTLQSAFVDAFHHPELGLLRFARDAEGKVTGFGLSIGRARSIAFVRRAE